MANALYDKGRESFLRGQILWHADTIRVVLVDTGAYTPALATDQFLSDIPAPARVATSSGLAGKTTTAGVADASDIVITAVSGPSVEAAIIYQDTGIAATSRLIAYIDMAGGLPFTPGGGDQLIQWHALGIFKL